MKSLSLWKSSPIHYCTYPTHHVFITKIKILHEYCIHIFNCHNFVLLRMHMACGHVCVEWNILLTIALRHYIVTTGKQVSSGDQLWIVVIVACLSILPGDRSLTKTMKQSIWWNEPLLYIFSGFWQTTSSNFVTSYPYRLYRASLIDLLISLYIKADVC